MTHICEQCGKKGHRYRRLCRECQKKAYFPTEYPPKGLDPSEFKGRIERYGILQTAIHYDLDPDVVRVAIKRKKERGCWQAPPLGEGKDEDAMT